MSQIEYDLNDMEVMEGKGSTSPQKRKVRVNIGDINMERGVSITTLSAILDQARDKITKEGLTDDMVQLQAYDSGEDGWTGYSLVVKANRLETDEEYQERLKRIEQAKLTKREFDLKKFYELKKELGL